jgi:hypothetical protein
MPQKVPKWIVGLEETDLAFIKRFVLASGSLKELARQYGITYPTLRLRLDKLIERVKALDDKAEPSDFRRYVKVLALDGRLDVQTAKELIRLHENCKGEG